MLSVRAGDSLDSLGFLDPISNTVEPLNEGYVGKLTDIHYLEIVLFSGVT